MPRDLPVLSDTDVAEPDLLFISRAREHTLTDENVRGAPDLVIEILSPSTADRDLGYKHDLYGRHGVLEYWVVDPMTKTVAVHRQQDGERELTGAFGRRDTLRTPLLKGLELQLDDIFPAIATNIEKACKLALRALACYARLVEARKNAAPDVAALEEREREALDHEFSAIIDDTWEAVWRLSASLPHFLREAYRCVGVGERSPDELSEAVDLHLVLDLVRQRFHVADVERFESLGASFIAGASPPSEQLPPHVVVQLHSREQGSVLEGGPAEVGYLLVGSLAGVLDFIHRGSQVPGRLLGVLERLLINALSALLVEQLLERVFHPSAVRSAPVRCFVRHVVAPLRFASRIPERGIRLGHRMGRGEPLSDRHRDASSSDWQP